ncbi:ShlB/FhaC/HecB family hemolysin secretion/activation protein [Magnetococcus sp. PR-3]|uniref:ShlB/FhaC/HecB family hemolysin secretion/activation protein n=1 Tax=Magnetococcus sp. PR-3 TaxID=3120355 RepID=UPI002FCE671A
MSRKVNTGIVLGALLCVWSGSVNAQATPDAGSLLREHQKLERAAQPVPVAKPEKKPAEKLEVAPAGPGDAGVNIQQVRFEGNASFVEEVLQSILAPYMGQKYTMAGLKQLTKLIANHYRKHGMWAKVTLPAQKLGEGTLTMRIVEAHLGAVTIEHKEERLRLYSGIAQWLVRHGQPQKGLFSPEAMKKAIKTLDDVPGVTAAMVLKSGEKEGDTDVVVRMANTPLLSGSATLDNYGSKSSGQWRGTGAATVDSFLGLGEQLGLNLTRQSNTNVYTGKVSIPLRPDGARLSGSYMWMDYVVPSTVPTPAGIAESLTLTLSQPMHLAGGQKLDGTLELSRRFFLDEIGTSVYSKRRMDSANAGLSSNWSDGWKGGGSNTLGSNLYVGKVTHSVISSTSNAPNDYAKLGVSYSRLQQVGDKSQLWLSIKGQYAMQNLVSAEKFSLGGSSGLRAYPPGEGSGDHGVQSTVELRHPLMSKLQGFVFYDHGWIQVNHSPWANWNAGSTHIGNRYYLHGVGIGVNWALYKNVMLSSVAATRIGLNGGRDSDGNDADGKKQKLRLWTKLTMPF